MEKYEWLPTESSPLLYPMNIYQGYLFLEDGSKVYVPCSGVSHTGWGYSGSTHTQGDDMKALPVKLEVTWASFLENKFYKGSWELPVDKIKKLFKEGTVNSKTNEKESYSSVVVGLAPGGVAVVWLYGNDQQIEIGRYQAKETQVAMEDYVPGNPTITQKEYFDMSKSVPEAYENMKNKGIQFGIWDTYRKKYNWKTTIEIPNHTLKNVNMEMYNGEEETLFNETLKENPFKQRAVPRLLSYVFEDKNGEQNVFEVRYFDEGEIFALFKELDENKPVEIILRMTEDLKNRRLVLKQENKEFPIQKIDTDNMWKLKK
ncbi:DUF2931 family protein [Chryseobacterium herbae]|uniref:DUF2931 family protein n=1 Tax=Chryseobacterium herbae TaxID=2976476 RepID=A0ABT2IS91_9FLAO|nr:DUF2931 family protein [Chryseobacterium sp. pc1-10]MCT2561530.1 DUF2931 family protein [Chryseobacterium sp. pc1-10]